MRTRLIFMAATAFLTIAIPFFGQSGSFDELTTDEVYEHLTALIGKRLDLKTEKRNSTQYRELLMELARRGDQTTKSGNGEAAGDVRKSLMEIARDFAANPELVEELISEYSYQNPMESPRHAVLPTGAREEHKTERYRLAWEALLLSPDTLETRPLRMPIFDALSSIEDPRSVPALVEAFRVTLEGEMGTSKRRADRRADIIGVLLDIQDEVALRGIMACLDHEDQYCARNPRKDHQHVASLREWTFRGLVDPNLVGSRASMKKQLARAKAWKQIIDDYEQEGLSEKNAAFLQKLKGHTVPDTIPPRDP